MIASIIKYLQAAPLSYLLPAALKSITKYKNGRIANQVLYDYYQLKRKSKPGNVALGAVMNKLVRIIFSILNSQNDFIMITQEQQCLLYKHRLKVIA